MLRLPAIYHLLLVLFAVAGPAQGASFDCTKASTHVEQAICATPDVGALDVELAASFKEGLKTHAPPEWREEQRVWLRDVRDRCTDADCLRSAYAARLDQLAHRDDPAPVDASVYGTYITPTESGYFDPDAGDWKVGPSADCLTIAPAADGGTVLDIESEQTNGHSCALSESAHRVDDGFEFTRESTQDDPWQDCRLRLVVKQGVLEVDAEGCHGYCGARAGLDGLTFPRALKQPNGSTCAAMYE